MRHMMVFMPRNGGIIGRNQKENFSWAGGVMLSNSSVGQFLSLKLGTEVLLL